jgi:hypothetical protein
VWLSSSVPNSPVCVCGHQREAHEHYRSGTDCATCGPELCPRFRRAILRRKQPPTPPPARPDVVGEVDRVAAGPSLLLTGPLAIVSDLRAYAARRISAL